MRNIHKYIICWASVQILLCAAPGYAEDSMFCAPPEKVSFTIKKADMIFPDQYQGFVALLENEDITFVPVVTRSTGTSALASSVSGTWNFGDNTSSVPLEISVPDKLKVITHRYIRGGKKYTISLAVSMICANGQQSSTYEYSKTIYISSSRSDGTPIPEGFASCKRYSDIPESGLAALDVDSRIYLIRSLRNDIRSRQEVIERVKEVKKELCRVSPISNPDIRKNEMKRLVRMIDKADSLVTQSTEENSLQSIKDMLITSSTATGEQYEAYRKDIQRLIAMEVSTEKSIIKQCNSTLAVVESRVRKRGNRLIKQINELDDLSKKPEFDKGKWKDYDADLAGKKAMVREIDRVTRLTANDLFQTFDDYEQYFFKFMIGYSYTMINKLMQEGKPVVGFVVYRRMSNNEIADSEHGWDWPLRYGAHLKFAALFSGSGEQATVVSDPPPAVTNPGNNNSVGFNEELFMPLLRSERFNNNKLWEYFGPVALIGVNITQKDTENSVDNAINTRLYGGIKFAINPELYADILYGRTSGLYSKRLELRAQLPVYRFAEGSRLFLGAVANFGVKDKVANEADNISIYMTWNINFDAVFSYFSGKPIDDTAKQ